MNYDALRHLADSWGLVFLGLLFLSCVGWALRPGAKARHHHAAASILHEDTDNG